MISFIVIIWDVLPKATFIIIVLSLFIFGGNIKYTISLKYITLCFAVNILFFSKPARLQVRAINLHNVKAKSFFPTFLDKNNSQDRVSFESMITLQESAAQWLSYTSQNPIT